MGVLREYSQGVFKWLATTTELRPSGRGTTLTHSVRIEPAGLMGRLVAAVEVARKGRRLVERVYRRIDAYLTGGLAGRPDADPFEEPAGRPRIRRRLEPLLHRLVRAGVEPGVALALGEFLAEAPPLAVARIRPLALARRLGLDPEALTAACLVGAREGLLVLLWDLLCPVCRIPAAITDTLRALAAHAHCPACYLDFELDFANSVEMIFRVHPQVRPSDLGTYCIGGPFHAPHVAAQVRLAPGERVDLELALPEGAYRVRGPQLPWALDFRAGPSGSATRWDLPLGRAWAWSIEPPEPPLLRAGRQLLVLTSEHDRELLVRVERTVQRADALTAARASSLALFRELFPYEVLSPGQLVSVSAVTLLVTDLDRADDLYASLGDARAFALLQEHFQAVGQCIARAGGAVVKTVGEGVVATFNDPAAAVRAGLALLKLDRSGPPLGLRVGAHSGPVLAANLSDHLDYFGATVNEARRLPQLLQGGQMVLTGPVVQDPEVAALLRARGLAVEVLPAALPGPRSGILHRVVPPTA
jgi:class 3 adenylate cyclase